VRVCVSTLRTLPAATSFTMVEKITRKVRITTKQTVLENEEKIDGVFPMREWRISIHLVGADGKLYPATVFDRVTYQLHETFANPRRVLTEPPFELVEKGWGEFEMRLTFRIAHGGGDVSTGYDLHFRSPENHQDIPVGFPANKKDIVAELAKSGPVPSSPSAGASAAPAAAAPNAEKRAGSRDEAATKTKKPKVTIKGSVDLERLSSGLEQLGEQDVLSIVQMISDNKTPEIYVKNDVDAGEFHVDLFTLPNGLLKSIWDFVEKKVEV